MAWTAEAEDFLHLLEDGSDVLLCAREPPTLLPTGEEGDGMPAGFALKEEEVEEDGSRRVTPPASGGVAVADPQVWLDQFLVGDEKPTAEAAKLQGEASANTTAPASPSHSHAGASSMSTPAPGSPEDNGTPPPPAGTEKRKRDDDEGSGSSRSPSCTFDQGVHGGDISRGRSPESVEAGTNSHYRSMALRPEDDPAGLFQKDPKTLTCEELKMIKKQKRLIKNRESAQLSRHRKKQHVEGLQASMSTMEKERNAAEARAAELARENAALKAQLIAAGLTPVVDQSAGVPAAAVAPPAAQTSGAAPAAAPAAPAAGTFAVSSSAGAAAAAAEAAGGSGVAKAASSMALACVFAVGLLFTGLDLSPRTLPAAAVAPSSAKLGPMSSVSSSLTAYRGAGGVSGRSGAGRVLLSTENSDASTNLEMLGDKRQLLIVTLLDHIVGSAQKPKLYSRMCKHLVEMGVLDGCAFLGSMGDMRTRYMTEFASLHHELAQDEDEAKVETQFTFGSKALANTHSATSWDVVEGSEEVPLDLPTVPLPMSTDGLWGLLKGKGVRSKFNVLCPSAKFLISDSVADVEDGVGSRLAGKERGGLTNTTALPPPPGAGRSAEGGTPRRMGGLSMVLPSSAIGANSQMGHFDDAEGDELVELRCEAFDVRPLSLDKSASKAGEPGLVPVL